MPTLMPNADADAEMPMPMPRCRCRGFQMAIQKIVYKYKDHPSILKIKENVEINDKFNFDLVTSQEINQTVKKTCRKNTTRYS